MRNATVKLSAILKFAKNGLAILPLVPRSKKPAVKGGVYAATTDRKKLKQHFECHQDRNYGVATGGPSDIFVVDVDGKKGKASLRSLEAKHGQRLPKTVTVRSRRGRHYYFRCGDTHAHNSVGRLGEGIDVRGDGGYVVGPGSVHQSGFIYRFVDGRALDEIKIADPPKWLRDLVDAKTEEITVVKPIPAVKLERARAYAEAARKWEPERLGKAPKHQRNHTLNICAFKLGQLLPYGLLDIESIRKELAQQALAVGLDDKEIGPTIDSGLNAGRKNPRHLPFAKVHKTENTRDTNPPRKSNIDLIKDLAKLGETDTDNAQRFASRFGSKVVYTPGHGWLIFDGKRWRRDSLHQCIELAKHTARRIGQEARYFDNNDARAARAKFGKACLSKGALERMLDLAKGLLVVEDSKLDADPWLLNTETGTIDLRTGRVEPHDPRDLLTNIAPVAADRKAKCPTFRQFLKRVTGSDRELMAYIQKAVGYTLTGLTSEQALFFVYGRSGSNGKSTLVNPIRDMMGDYGAHTPTESLMIKQYDNAIPADLARLAGVRMVTAIETNFSRQLDEAKIKAMTGGEPITARFMRQNFFEFTPAFKLWLVGNDRPRVRGTDDAFWRRVRVIPLEVRIPKKDRDPDLPNKLRAEWPGILAWAVRGCRKWQREGLSEPDAVIMATSRWRSAADHVKRFGQEVLILEDKKTVSASAMYTFYDDWCSRNGEQPLSIKGLKTRLIDLFDLTHKRTNRGSDWVGVKFRL